MEKRMEAGTDFKFRDDLFDAKDAGSTCPVELMLEIGRAHV